MDLAHLTVEEAAAAAVDNWQSWECFIWHPDDLQNTDGWFLAELKGRDSGLITQSNSDQIEEALAQFEECGDVRYEHHSHPLHGWLEGVAIRVYRDGQVTEAFQTFHELLCRLAEYPLLDEADLSRREYEATLENFDSGRPYQLRDCELPDDWAALLFTWFWKHDQRAVDSVGDQGGFPTDAQYVQAFTALGWYTPEVETVE